MRYDLHGWVELVFDTRHQGWRRYFENEYGRIARMHRGEGRPSTRILVRLVDELPPSAPGDVRRTVNFKKLFRFSYAVRGLTTPQVEIHFRHHPVDRVYTTAAGVFLQAQVLEPILYMKLLEQGVLLMHAAGVAAEGAGYLFPAQGGTGKTTLSLALVREGFTLLGDDLVLVDSRTGVAYPYPRPLHLFTYNLRALRDAGVPLRVRAAVRAKDVIRLVLERVTRQKLLISTRVHVDEIDRGVRFSEPVPYRRIAFLRRDGADETTSFAEDGARSDFARLVTRSADLNESLYENVLDEASAERVRALEQAVAEDVLAHVEGAAILNARRLGEADVARLAERLRS